MTKIIGGDVPDGYLARVDVKIAAGEYSWDRWLVVHFHQFMVKVLRKIRCIRIANID
jgi:hypothetical protein